MDRSQHEAGSRRTRHVERDRRCGIANSRNTNCPIESWSRWGQTPPGLGFHSPPTQEPHGSVYSIVTTMPKSQPQLAANCITKSGAVSAFGRKGVELDRAAASPNLNVARTIPGPREGTPLLTPRRGCGLRGAPREASSSEPSERRRRRPASIPSGALFSWCEQYSVQKSRLPAVARAAKQCFEAFPGRNAPCRPSLCRGRRHDLVPLLTFHPRYLPTTKQTSPDPSGVGERNEVQKVQARSLAPAQE